MSRFVVFFFFRDLVFYLLLAPGENETKMKLELDLALSTASQLSLDPSELKKLAIKFLISFLFSFSLFLKLS